MKDATKILTSCYFLNKDVKKWLRKHSEVIENNRKILKEIGNLLGEEISENDFYYESIEISPSNKKTKQIVFQSSPRIIEILDRFLLEKKIVSLKEENCLRIDFIV